ncbi:MAG: hypothetical protein ACUVWX_05990 [Kiritimatiellia bacterium]
MKKRSVCLEGCRATIDGQVDASSVTTIVRDVINQLPENASVEDKVLALYRYVRRHLFAYLSTMDDTFETLNKAVYTLNWWGFGLCGRQSKTLGMLAAELLGRENVRLVGMRERWPGAWRVGEEGRPYAFHWTRYATDHKPGTPHGHTSLEIRWDDSWHFLDVMVGFYRRDASGRIVSIREIADRPELVAQPVGDPEGDMPYGPEPEIFTQSGLTFHEPGLNTWPGELSPLNLRPGESFTFLYRPLPGEFVVHPRMRKLFREEALKDGPREGRRNAPPATYANAEHRYRVKLEPSNECPYWCAPTGDWHIPVTLPYPITSIRWRMVSLNSSTTLPCSGFLHYPPSTGDELMPVAASGSYRPGPDDAIGTSYKFIVRAPARKGCVELDLITCLQHNPLVCHRLKPGLNVVRLHAEGTDHLVAIFSVKVAGQERKIRLEGVGSHEVTLPPEDEVEVESVTLENAAGTSSFAPETNLPA